MALSEVLAANKLQVALTSVVVVAVGGAATYMALTGGLLASEDMLGAVPAEADTVMHVDGDITEDETTRALVDEFIDVTASANESYDGPDDFEAAVEEAENDSELSLDGFHGMTAFSAYGDEGESNYSGAVVDSDWETDAFVEATANGSDYEQRTYQGYTVYVVENNESTDGEDRESDSATTGGEFESETEAGGFESETEAGGFGEIDVESETDPVDSGPTWIAVLDDGEFATGTEAAVKDAVDVDRGAGEAIDDDLRNAYESSPDGHVRFAGTVPEDADEANLSAANETAAMTGIPGLDNIDRLRNLLDVESYAGAYYTDGSGSDGVVGYEFRLTARNGDTAADLRDLLGGTLTAMEYTVPPNETAALLDNTTISRDGADVVVTFESSPAGVADGYRALIDFAENATGAFLGSGTGYGEGYGDSYGENWSEDDSWGEEDSWGEDDGSVEDGDDSFGEDDSEFDYGESASVERAGESRPVTP
ncbi:hypothetical protein BV210_03685 [Halorientalis sp. IM1011]|uniref:hypothetical protein n=1 Tax=Halorientalis sp. IM1011 TaxID=1932360 RepID=UPI00097CCF55|nr:hypothetical protein [Halorientalis sp. IM1011]AQL41871.1 hypothetical protein BV210_03685 [Halorientalis sp. IM1011]